MIVMICIDHFSKMVQLLPLQKSYIHTIAGKFLSVVVSLHGFLECILSYCDPCFCGHFWDELMSLLDITLTFSIALHP